MSKTIRQAHAQRLVLLGVLLAMMLAQGLLHAGAAEAQRAQPAYYCGTLSSGHCYGTTDWYGPQGSHLGGVQTDINVEYVQCYYCVGGSLSNEIWMIDSTSNQTQYCTGTQTPACWVEAGYEGGFDGCGGFGFYGFQCYFWSDSRPNGGYYNHFNNLPSDNYYHHTRFKIKWLGNGSWDVSVNPLSTTDGYWDQTSTSNTIYPQDMTIGSELEGYGASDDNWITTVDYLNSKWADANGNFNFQGSKGTEKQSNPPDEIWGACCTNGGDFKVWTPQGS